MYLEPKLHYGIGTEFVFLTGIFTETFVYQIVHTQRITPVIVGSLGHYNIFFQLIIQIEI